METVTGDVKLPARTSRGGDRPGGVAMGRVRPTCETDEPSLPAEAVAAGKSPPGVVAMTQENVFALDNQKMQKKKRRG